VGNKRTKEQNLEKTENFRFSEKSETFRVLEKI